VSAPFTVWKSISLRRAAGYGLGDPQLFTHREDLLGDLAPGQAEWRARAHISTAGRPSTIEFAPRRFGDHERL